MKTRHRIKKHLESGKKLTSIDAFKKFNTLTLQQHIHALRRQGVNILTTMWINENTGVRYAEYKII